ncbi:protein Red [Nephila pilipes]|uniref:Protein Red n=1 Tax=Nephila pilipes TaxID=299642 RepID=A0A8X6UH86_NEPPI|nr:protein Red [Nephila pilipes]
MPRDIKKNYGVYQKIYQKKKGGLSQFLNYKLKKSRLRVKLTRKLERDMPESYAECYPGAPEHYSEYVSNKETLPKAAFRYGIQIADGRKIRTGKRDEKINGLLFRETHFVS